MSKLNLPALYAALPPERQRLLDEVNFLAGNLREDLVLEQVYLALAALSHRLQQLHPEIGCPGGCSRCCESYALPETLPMEWELIAEALNQLAPEDQGRIREAVAAATGLLDENGELRGQRRDHAAARCPLLLDGRCSVYAVRPFDCRVTGYAFSTSGERPLPGAPPGQPLPYSCQSEQLRMLNELGTGRKPLEYMFMPQREALLQALRRIEPSDGPPRLLLQRLADWAASLG